jgi:uncharacterized protein (TIGR00645 family)
MEKFEEVLEKFLFLSRWAMAPFYIGLVVALVLLLVTFMKELLHFVLTIFTATEADVILGILTMVDLSLTGNLLVMVVFSGYENFVSKMQNIKASERPDWMGTIDFSAMKLKLLASIIAISSIHLLKSFYNIDKITDRHLMWLVIIHAVFVISGLILAWSDKIVDHGSKHAPAPANDDIKHH